MKIQFVQPRRNTTKLYDMVHGDMYEVAGMYFVRTWDGVVSLRPTIERAKELVPFMFQHFGTGGAGKIDGNQRALVIGRMVIKVD